jgi:hypothetical protein
MKKRDQKYEEYKTKREFINSRQVLEEASLFIEQAIEDKFSIGTKSTLDLIDQIGLELKR